MNENQNVNNENENSNEMGANEYIEKINELKQNSVPKEKYMKILEDNKALTEAVLNGASVDAPQVNQQQPVDNSKRIEELRGDIFGKELDNLTYWKKTLELRELIKKEKDEDIFVASNDRVTPTDFDYQCAERVADVVQQCIEQCDGNSKVFTTLIQERTKDIKLPNRK